MRVFVHRLRYGLLVLPPIALVLLSVLPIVSTRADTQSLFGRSAPFASMDSFNPVLTPDNRFVIFKADLETDNVYNIYRVPATGGEPIQLSDEVAAGRGVRRFALSPDGTRVVYISQQEVENREELYSVPVESGSPTKLSGALVAGGNVQTFQISPNDALVAYLADQDANDVFELYSAPIGGGGFKKLNGALVAGGDVLDDFRFSQNTQFVVYRADQEANARFELYGAPTGNGVVEKLNGALAAGGQVDYFRLSPVLNIATYVAKIGASYEIYSVQLNGNPINGGNPLNGALTAGQRVTFSDITPDGQRVAYVVGSGFFGGADGVLYSVPIVGGASAQLSPTPSADGGVNYFRISPDSAYAVFGYKASEAAAERLYSVGLDGNGQLPIYDVAQDHGLYDLRISPDSDWVVFGDYDLVSSVREQIIYALPLRGGTPVQLSLNSRLGFSPQANPASDRVLFYEFRPGDPECEESNLYSAQIFGGGRRELTALCGTRGNIDNVAWSADSSRIVYSVSFDDEERNDAGFEIFISDGEALPPTATATSTATGTATETTTPTVTPTGPAQAPEKLLHLPLIEG
jgi:Tol biopolymer transport system component